MHWEPSKNSSRKNVRASGLAYSKRKRENTGRDVTHQQNLNVSGKLTLSTREIQEGKVNPVGTAC